MILTEPMPFAEAVQAAKIRTLLPTSGKTVDLQRMEAAIKRRALWSATVQSVETLQDFGRAIDGLLVGSVDQATARAELKQLLEARGYRPDPAAAGGLEDLGSDRRLNLILETNVQTAQGYGSHLQGMQEAVLDEWPAQELFRAFSPADSAAKRDWAARWAACGGDFVGNRMIALKTDPVWAKLGDPALFADGLGNPYPPFAFNSGMDVRDIGRDEAVSLGLIDADTQLTPEPADDFAADAAASPEIREDWLRSALGDSGLGAVDAAGVFHFNDGGVL